MEQQIILALILLTVIFLYVTQLIPLEITSISIIPVLALLCPYMETKDLFGGISSPATITIICMFILSAGLVKSGSLEPFANFLSKKARKGYFTFLIYLAIFVPIISAFINNTPLVVMLVPIVLSVARENGIMPSKLLIPLSFFSILGGTFTLIGTNTNIIVNQIYVDTTGSQGFGMFDFSPIGIVYIIVGITFILTIGFRLLPERTSLTGIIAKKSTAKYVTQLSIPAKSSLCGMLVSQAFVKDKTIKILEVIRGEDIYFKKDFDTLNFQVGDALIVEASVDTISKYMGKQFDIAETLSEEQNLNMHSIEVMIDEAVVLPDSKFVGATLESLKLSHKFGAVVLGIQRGGRHHRKMIGSMSVRAGDVLLIQANEEGFERLKNTGDVLLLDNAINPKENRHHAMLALSIMAAVVILSSITSVPLVVLSIIGCICMFVFKIIDFNEGFAAVDIKVILLLVGAIPLGVAMQKSGIAQTLVHLFDLASDGLPMWVMLSMFYLVTSLLTEVLCNKTTAVLMTPIALQFAMTLGVDPKPFLMAICFSASASFITPIGYATNTIVMGPGGYKFTDYMKIGIPLNICMWILATILIPIVYPF